MKCNACDSNLATYHETVIADGLKTECHYCEACVPTSLRDDGAQPVKSAALKETPTPMDHERLATVLAQHYTGVRREDESVYDAAARILTAQRPRQPGEPEACEGCDKRATKRLRSERAEVPAKGKVAATGARDVFTLCDQCSEAIERHEVDRYRAVTITALS